MHPKAKKIWIVVIGVGCFGYMYFNKTSKISYAEPIHRADQAMEMVNTDLYTIEKDATANSLQFNEKYDNKRVVFNSKIASGDIHRNGFNSSLFVVEIEASDGGFIPHRCNFPESEKPSLVDLRKGQAVRISGTVAADGNSIEFFKCKFEQ